MSGDGGPAFPEWRPIKTAPLDQRVVLIWCPKEYRGNGGMHVAAHMNFSDRPGWYSHVSATHEPTHWMPLPPRPNALLAELGERDDG